MHLCEGVIVPRRVATSVDARKGWVKWLVVQTLARRASQSSSYRGRDGNEREDDAHNPMAAAMTRRRARQPRYLCMAFVECLLLLGALLLGLWQASHAEHTASLRWMRGYRSADGVGCCSEHDCIPWPVALLQITGNEATVLLGDTVLQLPIKSVHATQDGQTYWCCQTNTAGRCPDVPTRATTRCVFYTVGM